MKQNELHHWRIIRLILMLWNENLLWQSIMELKIELLNGAPFFPLSATPSQTNQMYEYMNKNKVVPAMYASHLPMSHIFFMQKCGWLMGKTVIVAIIIEVICLCFHLWLRWNERFARSTICPLIHATRPKAYALCGSLKMIGLIRMLVMRYAITHKCECLPHKDGNYRNELML